MAANGVGEGKKEKRRMSLEHVWMVQETMEEDSTADDPDQLFGIRPVSPRCSARWR